MLLWQKCKRVALAIPMVCRARASKARSCMPPRPDRLTCRQVQDKATDLAERKELKARWAARISEAASRVPARETAAVAAKALRPADLDRSRSCAAPDPRSRKRIPDRPARR